MAELAAELNRIVAAVREVVPERYHEAILARVNGEPAPPVAEVEAAPWDESYDPLDDGYEDDED